jgi:hypothetical protein
MPRISLLNHSSPHVIDFLHRNHINPNLFLLPRRMWRRYFAIALNATRRQYVTSCTALSNLSSANPWPHVYATT